MRISEIYNLGVTQMELDFVDIDLDRDYPLFIDPFLIGNSNNPWSIKIDRIIKSFFNKFKNHINLDEIKKAKEMFIYMSEPKETCLGVSTKGTLNGRGVGGINANKIIEKVIASNAIENNLVNNIEDLMVFVEDIDKDKISDMVTNIIRGELIEYTKFQCDLWGITTSIGETLPFWDAIDNEWVYTETKLLIVEGRDIILVPKAIVSPISFYTASKYNWHFIIEQERSFHLRRKSSLVKYKKLTDGREKYYLPKKDVQEDINKDIRSGKYLNTKDYIRRYTQQYPKLFEDFIETCKKNVSSLSNDELVSYISDIDIETLIDKMICKLKNIPSGRNNATEYHHFVKSLLEIIFYPNLINPIIEKEIHDGRKRIDIVMDNNSRSGFFHRLHSISKIYCPYVYIECKNYGKDIANPEIDQLAGRFGINRGQFGFLLCRDLQDERTFINRCKDTFKDNRGLIIAITDKDIIQLLTFIKKENYNTVDEYLEQKKREIMLG